jgi:hypothetical protein
MRHVREDVAAHDAGVRHAEGLRGLHVLQFAQLQRLGAQQPAQPGPAGQAQHRAQQEQLEVGAFGTGLEQIRVAVEEHLHHQHAGGDQQHVRHRRQHGVEVLDQLVHPAAHITRQNAESDRQRQRGHARQGADDEGGADALQRLVEHVVAGQVGAEHMVVAGQRHHGAGQQADDQQRHADRTPRDPALATPGRKHALGQGPTVTPGGQRQQRGREQPGDQGPQHQPGQAAPGQVAEPLRGRVVQVRAAELQPRRDALDLAVHLHRFLGEADVGQGSRVGGLARIDQAHQQRVEQRARARVVGRRSAAVADSGRQQRPVVHAVQQRDAQAQQQHHRRGQRACVGEDLGPVGAQPWPAQHHQHIGGQQQRQQPDGGIGPEQHELRHVKRGVRGGRPRYRPRRSGCRRRCTAASPGRPSCAPPRSPAG